jgi:hypothetical protein
MLFDKFIKQYLDDLIECSDIEYDLTDEDKKEIIDNVRYNDFIWETLDNAIFTELEDYKKEGGNNE